MILPFEELYKTKLAPAIKQFKEVRRKLHFSIISVVSGVIILAIGLFMLLNSAGYEDNGGMLKIWLLLFGITMLFLVINTMKKEIGIYSKHLMLVYALLNFAGFFLFNSLPNVHSGSLLLCLSMVSMSVGIIGFLASGVLDNYAGQYQRTVLDEMMMHMGMNIRYSPESKINSRDFLDSKIINIYERNYKGWDLVELEYGTQQFKFCNVRITTDSSSPKNNFMGIFLVADISRNLKGITKIANRDDTKMEGFLKDLVSVDRLAMQTNYPKLEKYLKVSATHPQETEELLTLAFVRRLLRFCRKINLTSIPNAPMLFRLHLQKQKLYMTFKFGIDDYNLLQAPKLMGNIDYENMLRINHSRLKIILDWIEDLHLTNTEWANAKV